MLAAMTPARDIPLLITSTASSSERRITPSWTIAHLKTKLEPVTGIPPSSQILSLRLPDQQHEVPIHAEDEDAVEIGRWSLVPYAEIKVTSTGNTIISNLPPVSSVPRYTMPEATYETLPETVLAYKRSHKIGRFDPAAPEIQERKVKEMWNEVEQRSTSQSPAPPGESLNRSSGVKAGARCRLAEDTTRRGSVAFVGPISSLPGPSGAPWIGIALDEPTGKNDGSIKGERYFQCEKNRGIFVRADRVEVGDWGELGLEEEDPDMEEI